MATTQHQHPQAQPKTVLRGHQAQIHATAFVRDGTRLATGDAAGFVVLWDLTIMRPRAVWQAHAGTILGVAGWGSEKIITHGRDNRLVVWKLAAGDEAGLSTALPLDDAAASDRPQPWMLHTLDVNTMNFCSFASCLAKGGTPTSSDQQDELLVAVPNTLASESVDIYHLPSQQRRHVVKLASKAANTGMVMALSLFWHPPSKQLAVIAAYENGLVIAARHRSTSSAWDILYKVQSHTQPILSLDLSPNKDFFLTSGADAIVAKHPIPDGNDAHTSPIPIRKGPAGAGRLAEMNVPAPSKESESGSGNSHKTVIREPIKTVNTKHSGQQGLRIRSDGRIFATAGWDSKVRVYSTKTMAELAVLKWHDVGCYSTAFAPVRVDDEAALESNSGGKDPEENEETPPEGGADEGKEMGEEAAGKVSVIPPKMGSGDLTVKERRLRQAKDAHWLVAGSKDGKVSLWDIY